MAYGLVGYGEFAKVMANHFRLDLYAVKYLAVVYANYRANHLGHDDHVAQVSFDGLRLIHWTTIFLGLAKPANESLRFRFQPSIDAATSAGVNEFRKLLMVKVQQLLELYPSEHELTKCSLLPQGCSSLHLGLVHNLQTVANRQDFGRSSVPV